MVTTAVLGRVLASTEGGLRRSWAVTLRNAVVARRSMYWLVLLTGLLEPALYLMSLGVGVGALIGDFHLPGGRSVSYAAYVAPATLASSAMTGAMVDCSMNFFVKMKYMKLYDAMITTPLSPFEIAVGELLWTLSRGMVYFASFAALMAVMDLTTPARAGLLVMATLLVGIAFGGLSLAIATFVHSWVDFDLLTVGMTALFLFSGTFTPVDRYPLVLRWCVELTPLYHGVELLRGISVGTVSAATLWHVGYLLVLAGAGLAVAGRRTTRRLCP